MSYLTALNGSVLGQTRVPLGHVGVVVFLTLVITTVLLPLAGPGASMNGSARTCDCFVCCIHQICCKTVIWFGKSSSGFFFLLFDSHIMPIAEHVT